MKLSPRLLDALALATLTAGTLAASVALADGAPSFDAATLDNVAKDSHEAPVVAAPSAPVTPIEATPEIGLPDTTDAGPVEWVDSCPACGRG